MLTGDTSELLVNGAAFKLIIITILLAAVILMLVWFCNKQKRRNKTSSRNHPSVFQAEAIASQQVSERESLDLDPQLSERESLDLDTQVSERESLDLVPQVSERESIDLAIQVSERESLDLDPQVSERESLNLAPQVSERESLDLAPQVSERESLDLAPQVSERESLDQAPQVSERESIDLVPQRMINTIVQGRSIESGGSLEDQLEQSSVSSSTQPSLADRRLIPNNLHQVYTEVYATRPKWNNIGLAFNLPPDTLESIRMKHREDPDSCLREMLYTRLKLEHPLTWRDVINGLRCNTVGETALANKLATKYGLVQNISPELETPECVVRYSSYLKDRYKQMSVLPDPDWPPAITTEQHYTTLALIERERHILPRAETSETMAYDYAHGKIDNIVARKQEIQLEDAFLPIIDPGSKDSRLTILMDGAPGVGKTTISRKVCIDWANGELLQEYQLVILVPLREVIFKQTEHQSIADLLPADDHELKDQLLRYIQKTSGANVLFIFDGFDELSSQQRNVQSHFLDVIEGSKFHRCSVLVTSRPYASGSLRRINRVNRHVEVLGFTKKQIEDCIHKNVPKVEAKQLIQKLKERLDIGSICYIPLNCRIVLFVYSQQKYELPTTLTQLYDVFILHTLKHHAEKITRDPTIIEEIQEASDIQNLPKSVQTQLDSLSEMAFSGIDKDQLVFINEELKTSRNSLSLGLLNAIETFTISGSRKLFQFLHLTIQEFLAARHIASGGISAVEKAVFMKSHINNERFRMTLLFLSGLTHLSFLPPGKSLLDWQTINLSSDYYHGDDKANFVFLAQLFYESENSSSRWLLSSLSSEVFDMSHRRRLSQFDCLVLAHFLSSTPQDHLWEAINFNFCYLTDDCLEILLSKYHSSKPGVPAVGLTKTLNVSGNSVTGPRVVSLFKALEKNTCLKTLDLSSNNNTAGEHSEAVGQAIEGMLRVNQSLQVLNLNLCHLDDAVISHIATGLTHNTTLQELAIGNNRSVTSDGWVQFFQAIQKGTTFLQTLGISVNNLQSEGVIALSQMLLHNKTITTLPIINISSSETITTEAWIQLFQVLRQNSTLSILDISDNNLGGGGSIALGECLHHNKTITVLEARSCGLTDDVLKAMATKLSHESSSLREIAISGNNSLTSEGWISVFQILERNSSLRMLSVRKSYKPMEVDRRGNVVMALAEMISRNKGIQELTISGEFIEDEHKLLARSLVQNTTLQELNVYSSTDRSTIDILEEEIEKLKQEEGIVPPDWNLKITYYSL